MLTCAGCDHQFRDEDLAPYQRNADGSFTQACRKCIANWIKMGVLWANIPFWKRKEGLG
jgi:hypothetical protein